MRLLAKLEQEFANIYRLPDQVAELPAPHQIVETCSTDMANLMLDTLALREALDDVLSQIGPEIGSKLNDKSMSLIALCEDKFEEPLSKHEVLVLAATLYQRGESQLLNYEDVLRLTDKFQGRAMNITMVYKTTEKLKERGLLVLETKAPTRGGERPSRSYAITEFGLDALRMAILNARVLSRPFQTAAA